ncbi:MAG: hypothetical protein FJX47_13535, partial [Alphaproteobacteria bacterium]|nr:hypothetical protein [Alphaproteobacteria bacterium]
MTDDRAPGGVFATFHCARRVWAVASVFGEVERLRRVHATLERRFGPGDRLVHLGNVIGGGAPLDCVDEILRLRRVLLARRGMEPWDFAWLRGMQEEMWEKTLQLHYAVAPLEVLDWMLPRGLGATLAAYGADVDHARAIMRQGAHAIARWTAGLREKIRAHPGHEEFFAHLRRAALTADHALLFVNAGIDPARPLDKQGDAFWWGGAGFSALAEPYGGFRMMVRGYDPGNGGAGVGTFKASIDGGAG